MEMKTKSSDSHIFVVVDGSNRGVMKFKGRGEVTIPDSWSVVTVTETKLSEYSTNVDKWDSRFDQS